MLLTSVSRNLILESGVRISSGHAEARAYVEQALSNLKGPEAEMYNCASEQMSGPLFFWVHPAAQ
jgi:hypothetical protein